MSGGERGPGGGGRGGPRAVSSSSQAERELLLGPQVVREALRAGRRKVRRIFLARDLRDPCLGEIVAQAGRIGIPVRQVLRGRLAALAGTDRHQGIIAVADPFAYADPAELAAQAKSRSPLPLLVALDGIEDPHNLGAILRTAEVFGADGIFLPKHRAAAVTASVLRTASGAAEHLPLLSKYEVAHRVLDRVVPLLKGRQ